ncbi:phosphoglycolate phosphatase [Hasllibacter sp. MH4015]|uniref:phosphoglycolate phosphatase n=1 Tax=Hasllibacter sp. MH4015 TaxID=2854029 RepID=UPI001CD3506C|nr:phosphoglycolate phosphatase [Hasllibacter sp. MH4015]
MARIVFDLDGTLIDSAPDIRLAANGALEGTGAAPLSLAETRGFVGAGAAIFVTRMMAARGLPDGMHGDLLHRFVARYEGAVHLTEIYPGAAEVLAELKGQGHRMGLCTNKPIAPTRAVLAHLDLARFFEVVIGGDSLSVRKPDPAPLRAALDALGEGVPIYVGDSEVDAETALRADVAFMLYTQGYRSTPVDELAHHAAFADWSEVPGLVTDLTG